MSQNQEALEYTLVDIRGTQVPISKSDRVAADRIQITPANTLAKGIYFLTIRTRNEAQTLKVIKY